MNQLFGLNAYAFVFNVEIITHGECRAIVKSCYPCEEHLYFLNSAKMAPYDCCQPGVVSVKLIQAYDLTVAQHTSLVSEIIDYYLFILRWDNPKLCVPL